MAVLNNNALVGAAGKGGTGAITTPQRSLRFNSADSTYLSRTPASAGNRTIYTWSFWIKRCGLGEYHVFRATSDASNYTEVYFGSNDKLNFQNVVSGTSNTRLVTTQVFRDTSAWYHFVIAINGSTSAKIYVNGTEITAYDTTVGPGSSNHQVNNTVSHTLGSGASTNYANFYLAGCHLIDGQALTPSDFAYPDPVTGRWEPKAYAGSYSGNSFYLDFSDNSAATATTLGADRSGLGNNWVPNNIQSIVSTAAFTANTTISTDKPLQIANIFDGSNTTMQELGGFTQNVYYTLSINRPISGSGPLVLFTSYGVSSGNINEFEYNITHNGGISTGWTAYSVPLGSPQNVTIGTFTNITQINIRCRSTTSSGNGGQYVYGFTFNGIPLIDTAYAAGNDSLRDHPVSAGIDGGLGGEVSGNYATLNPLNSRNQTTLANGNLDAGPNSTNNGTAHAAFSTIGVDSGKWYCEATVISGGSSSNIMVGISDITQLAGNVFDFYSRGYGYRNDALKLNNNSGSSYGATYTNNDVIGIALDLTAGTLVFYKNGSSQGTAFSGISSSYAYHFACFVRNTDDKVAWNFGQRPFAYTAPSGFKALCDTNLPDPLIKLPSTVMDVKRYDGNGSTQTVSGLGFSPDLVWTKKRNSGSNSNHLLADTVRGVSKFLSSSGAFDENTFDATWRSNWGDLTAFNSDGFTVVAGSSADDNINDSPNTHVAWCWDAGSTTTIGYQPAGATLPANVRANPASGFSIVTWTGGPGGSTVAHGLNTTPAFIVCKSRTATADWPIYHSALGPNKLLMFTTGTAQTISGYWGTPNSTTFGISNSGYLNNNGDMVAYCWAPIPGYSSFGIWQHNNSNDGPFISLDFRPRVILLKNSDNAEQWYLFDSSRRTYNVSAGTDITELRPNSSAAEGSMAGPATIDFLSNGFKIRTTSPSEIAFGSRNYIYCAWAENPFKYARAR